jgi:capsular exopolysaccharide synthesis family protein
VANLGASFAQGGRRVLVVDADLRRPSLHARYGLDNGVGLSTVLTGEQPWTAAVRRGPVPGLDVLSAGPATAFPFELLEGPAFRALLAEASGRYDVILVDTPPVIALADAQLVASRTDGVVLVVGIDRVTRSAAVQALDRLRATACRVVGLAVGGMRAENDWAYAQDVTSYIMTLPPASSVPLLAPPPAANGG